MAPRWSLTIYADMVTKTVADTVVCRSTRAVVYVQMLLRSGESNANLRCGTHTTTRRLLTHGHVAAVMHRVSSRSGGSGGSRYDTHPRERVERVESCPSFV